MTADPNADFPLEAPLFIRYRRSPRFAALHFLAHAGAIFCLFLTDLLAWALLAMGVGIAWHYRRYRRQRRASEGLLFRLDRQDRWRLLREGRDAVPLRLLPGALVHPALVVLRLREASGRTHACVLTRDNLDPHTLRRLRVRLRWSRGAPEQPRGRAATGKAPP